ncbi:MAG: YHS domain-containing protein [Bacteroidia bacterium]|nr:YHS domain-containing protein [Bacteroidia bacterium]
MNYLRTITLGLLSLTSIAGHAQQLLNLDDKGAIIDGYDPVAYFTEHMPVKGDPAFTSAFRGAQYYFASADNKRTFDADPARYEVQFGGFCAYAVSQGHVSPIDPNFCYIQKDEKGVDRLICQHNKKANELWSVNPDGLLVNAYKYWPAVEKNGGKQIAVKGVEHFFINIDKTGLAVAGYDVVAYHTDSKALKGDVKFTEWFHGAKYLFASAEHREMFRDNPKKFLPQYGGFCAYAMSLGKVRPVNPEIWSIESGRLMLQHTQEAYDLFYKDVVNNVSKADGQWPRIELKRAGSKVRFDKPAK